MIKKIRRAQRKVTVGKEKLAKTKEALVHATHDVKKKLGGVAVFAKHNPLKTIGFSALAGLIIAQLVRLRK